MILQIGSHEKLSGDALAAKTIQPIGFAGVTEWLNHWNLHNLVNINCPATITKKVWGLDDGDKPIENVHSYAVDVRTESKTSPAGIDYQKTVEVVITRTDKNDGWNHIPGRDDDFELTCTGDPFPYYAEAWMAPYAFKPWDRVDGGATAMGCDTVAEHDCNGMSGNTFSRMEGSIDLSMPIQVSTFFTNATFSNGSAVPDSFPSPVDRHRLYGRLAGVYAKNVHGTYFGKATYDHPLHGPIDRPTTFFTWEWGGCPQCKKACRNDS